MAFPAEWIAIFRLTLYPLKVVAICSVDIWLEQDKLEQSSLMSSIPGIIQDKVIMKDQGSTILEVEHTSSVCFFLDINIYDWMLTLI